MNARITTCAKCERPLGHGERKKLVIMRETPTGFSTDGFSRYLCPQCAYAIEEALGKWMEGVR